MRASIALPVALSSSLALACAGDDDTAADAAAYDAETAWDANQPGDGGEQPTCSFAVAAAQFTITSRDDYGGFSGSYRDSAWPQILMEHVRVGDCAFYAPEPSFCDPPCTDGVCAVGSICSPWPTNLAAGILTVTGTSPSLLVEQQAGGSYYTTESYPNLYQPGDLITLSGPGAGDVAPFELSVRGVPELRVAWDQTEAIEHQDMLITWETASSPPGTKVLVHMDNDHHGTAAYVECIAADTGSVTIDQTVLDPLIEAGHSGIGTFIENAYMARASASAQQTESGCVGFQSESMIFIAVETITAE